MDQFKGFYKKTTTERQALLSKTKNADLDFNTPLSYETAAHMVENFITTYETPMGLAPGFLVNDTFYNVPMVTEESSVIAAASKGAKIIAENRGFQATVIDTLKRGEIIYQKNTHQDTLINFVNNNRALLFDCANNAYPSILKRGGGVKDFKIRQTESFLIIDVYMDTQEAMGANMLNTVLESVANFISSNTKETHLFAILTNLTTECLVSSTCRIPLDVLGTEVAHNIALASTLAREDVYRATTHNKGVMNGIDAITIASGNDHRATNAAIHAFASLSGTYQPIATWTVENDTLIGTITLPIAIGSVGGAIALNPKAQLVHKILNNPTAKELMMIIASVGLAQNFAALLALTTEGIQKGHMALHATNLALSINTPPEVLDQVVALIQNTKPMNQEIAKKLLLEVLHKSKAPL